MTRVAVLLAVTAITGAAPAFADPAYTVTPMPPPDTRNNYVPPSGAIYVVNQNAGTITLCFPDTDKNKNTFVNCTTSTKLPQ